MLWLVLFCWLLLCCTIHYLKASCFCDAAFRLWLLLVALWHLLCCGICCYFVTCCFFLWCIFSFVVTFCCFETFCCCRGLCFCFCDFCILLTYLGLHTWWICRRSRHPHLRRESLSTQQLLHKSEVSGEVKPMLNGKLVEVLKCGNLLSDETKNLTLWLDAKG